MSVVLRPCDTSVDARMRHSLSQNLKVAEQKYDGESLPSIPAPPMAATQAKHINTATPCDKVLHV